MRLFTAMLGVCLVGGGEVAGPTSAGALTLDPQDGTAAEAVDEPAPPKATGGLTDGERYFQGDWQLRSYTSNNPTGTLSISDRDFSAETVHGAFAGYVSIRPDLSPAHVDFTIEGCDCKFDGMTSRAIYYEDDGAIVFAAPAPGEPRPEAFTGLDETKIMLERAIRRVQGEEGTP